MSDLTRRGFMAAGVAAGAIVSAKPVASSASSQDAKPGLPRIVGSENSIKAVEKVAHLLKTGADPLDIAIAAINIVEDDPNDDSVGYGGLPNEDGVVELDSSVMHGPTMKAGAVASIRNIKNPSKVAKLVMTRSNHVLLVGEGAWRFARAHGFKEENLLTEESRKKWLEWKESMSDIDDWIPEPKEKRHPKTAMLLDPRYRQTGTVHVSVLDGKGDLGGCTSTSGLSFKIPGRVGDSPIIGAGLYVDNEVGSAGSTGRGEANLVGCSSFLIVELMRQGKSPEEACLEACKRIADHNKEPRLRDKNGKPKFDVKFYAMHKSGTVGCASLYKGAKITVHDGVTTKHVTGAHLFDTRWE